MNATTVSHGCKSCHGRLIGIVLALIVVFPWPVCLAAQEVAAQWRIEATRWEEAEKIFHGDPRWLGGDGATAVDLGAGRVLWLFGDSFIDTQSTGSRSLSALARNSIAIQTGYDPSVAGMKFYWNTKDGKPAAFFAPKGDTWYWPASGIMLGRHLLIFLMEIGTSKNVLGFETRGWKAVWIDNPQEEPDRWNLTYLISPQRQGLLVGSGNPLLVDGFLQVFAAAEKDRSVYLVRWPVRLARTGTLTGPQWWAGEKAGWMGHKEGAAKPRRISAEGQMEFTVEYLPREKRYLQVQTLSVMNPCLAFAVAPATTGPWSEKSCFCTPAEQGRPDILIYAGKSHPMLTGADMVFTYVANTTREDKLLNDMSIYFPIMLKGRIVKDGGTP
ncbi:MAG: hypothetical protein ABFD81_13515 [Syntrophaceae bacterium]